MLLLRRTYGEVPVNCLVIVLVVVLNYLPRTSTLAMENSSRAAAHADCHAACNVTRPPSQLMGPREQPPHEAYHAQLARRQDQDVQDLACQHAVSQHSCVLLSKQLATPPDSVLQASKDRRILYYCQNGRSEYEMAVAIVVSRNRSAI